MCKDEKSLVVDSGSPSVVQACIISITWELVRDADSQALPQTPPIRFSGGGAWRPVCEQALLVILVSRGDQAGWGRD